MTLDAIKARDATWEPRCQWRSTLDRRWWPDCGNRIINHDVMGKPPWDMGHPFAYDPTLDTSPEADRRALLAMLAREARG